jgi:hypothetical protein
MLKRLAPDDPEPTAIRPIIEQLKRWSESSDDAKAL